ADARIRAATLEQPQRLAVAVIYFHADRRTELAVLGQLNPGIQHVIRIGCSIRIGHDLSMEGFSGDPDRCDHGKTEGISHPTDRVHDITLPIDLSFFLPAAPPSPSF